MFIFIDFYSLHIESICHASVTTSFQKLWYMFLAKEKGVEQVRIIFRRSGEIQRPWGESRRPSNAVQANVKLGTPSTGASQSLWYNSDIRLSLCLFNPFLALILESRIGRSHKHRWHVRHRKIWRQTSSFSYLPGLRQRTPTYDTLEDEKEHGQISVAP